MPSRFQTAKYNILPTLLANFQIQDVHNSLATIVEQMLWDIYMKNEASSKGKKKKAFR